MFKVQTDVFEGPLELLLELIEKRKLFINDVSLAKVTDDYIKHVKELKKSSIGDTVHFILVASTLLLIKSKSLLPGLELTEDETADIQDLERRLRLYKRIRRLGRHVRSLFGENIIFERQESGFTGSVFMPDKSITLSNIAKSAQELINQLPIKEKLSEVVVDKVISLEEMINRLAERIRSNIKLSFSEFAKSNGGRPYQDKEERINIVIGFLALLELVKQNVISVRQTGTFKDIEMETKDTTVPNYT